MSRKACFLLLAITISLVFALGGTMAAAADAIKIGAFFDLSGPASSIGTPTKLVAEMVVEKINKEGGINGRQLELVMGDTEGDPTKVLSPLPRNSSTWTRVAAIIGPTRTGTGMAVKKLLEKAQIPTFMTVGGDPVIMEGKIGKMDLGTARWIFKSPQRSSTAVKKVLTHLKAQGWTQIALITSSDSFGRDRRTLAGKTRPGNGHQNPGQGIL